MSYRRDAKLAKLKSGWGGIMSVIRLMFSRISCACCAGLEQGNFSYWPLHVAKGLPGVCDFHS